MKGSPARYPFAQFSPQVYGAASQRRFKVTEHPKIRFAIMALLSLITLTYACYAYGSVLPRVSHTRPGSFSTGGSNVPSLGVSDNIQQSWSMYSPYFAAETYQSPPKGCQIDQVCHGVFAFALWRMYFASAARPGRECLPLGAPLSFAGGTCMTSCSSRDDR